MSQDNFQQQQGSDIVSFTYDIPADKLAMAVEAFTHKYSYSAKVKQQNEDGSETEIDNPVSPRQHMLNCIENFVNETTFSYYNDQAQAQLQAQLAAQRAALEMRLNVRE